MATQLSVNINKIATIRNARGENNPNLLQVALDCQKFGAHGITVHPRPDERHIRVADVFALKERLKVEFNIEGYPSPAFLAMVSEVAPTQCTLVPDAPDVLTSNAGWQVHRHASLLKKAIAQLQRRGIRISLFMDPADAGFRTDCQILANLGADRIELYTKACADAYMTPEREGVTSIYRAGAKIARENGLLVNAGHDLSLVNLRYFLHQVGNVAEVSIGHALICDALYLGLEKTIEKYLDCMI